MLTPRAITRKPTLPLSGRDSYDVFSGFTTASMSGTGGGNGTAPGGNNTAVGGGGGNVTMSFDPSASASSGGAAPSAGPSGSGNFTGGGGDGGGSASKTDDTNFLRGGWPTNDEGIVTFNTMYPGFCEYVLFLPTMY